jgi:hypothetical protein
MTYMRHLTIILLLLLFTSCISSAPAEESNAVNQVTSTPHLDEASSNKAATLSSLEKLDDYPFYVMHYMGEYTYPKITASLPQQMDFSCSLFVALGSPTGMVYGRNFDWEYSPALLLFTDPPDGYASVSMADMTFLDISPQQANSAANLLATSEEALLSAPALPFDGMNEYGLTIGMAALPEEFVDDASYDPALPDIGSIGIIRQVLDHARNVDEAVSMFKDYNILFSGGPPIHYLIADPSGKAVLVEFYQNEMIVMQNEAAWHLATNHLRCIAEGDGNCYRYHRLYDQLNAANGRLDSTTAMQLLSYVNQDITQWSVVYDLSSGDVNVAIARKYEAIYTFHLELLKP